MDSSLETSRSQATCPHLPAMCANGKSIKVDRLEATRLINIVMAVQQPVKDGRGRPYVTAIHVLLRHKASRGWPEQVRPRLGQFLGLSRNGAGWSGWVTITATGRTGVASASVTWKRRIIIASTRQASVKASC